eukprot:EG_transcript_29694
MTEFRLVSRSVRRHGTVRSGSSRAGLGGAVAGLRGVRSGDRLGRRAGHRTEGVGIGRASEGTAAERSQSASEWPKLELLQSDERLGESPGDPQPRSPGDCEGGHGVVCNEGTVMVSEGGWDSEPQSKL